MTNFSSLDETKPPAKEKEEVKPKSELLEARPVESEAPVEDQGGSQDMDTEVSPKSEPMDVVSSLSGMSDLASHGKIVFFFLVFD